jgi:hypothetical protein
MSKSLIADFIPYELYDHKLSLHSMATEETLMRLLERAEKQGSVPLMNRGMVDAGKLCFYKTDGVLGSYSVEEVINNKYCSMSQKPYMNIALLHANYNC